MTSSSDPDVIRQQIEETRAGLSYDVDALNEKVNPARVVDRRVTKTKDAVDGLRNRVMGGSDDGPGRVSQAAHGATDAVTGAPDAALGKTQGNPLAAGLIAFGVGWLASSLLPTTQKEKELAAQAESAGQPLLERAKQAAQEVGENLKPAAQDAVESLKGTAQDAVGTVKQEGQSAASDVQGQAQQSREAVQGSQG